MVYGIRAWPQVLGTGATSLVSHLAPERTHYQALRVYPDFGLSIGFLCSNKVFSGMGMWLGCWYARRWSLVRRGGYLELKGVEEVGRREPSSPTSSSTSPTLVPSSRPISTSSDRPLS